MIRRTREQKILTQLKRLQMQLKEKGSVQAVSLKSELLDAQQSFTAPSINLIVKTPTTTTKNTVEDYSYVRKDLIRILALSVLAFAFEAVLYLTGIL